MALPVPLRPVQHHLRTAQEHEKRDPVVAYYCKCSYDLTLAVANLVSIPAFFVYNNDSLACNFGPSCDFCTETLLGERLFKQLAPSCWFNSGCTFNVGTP